MMNPGFEMDLMKLREAEALREGARRRLAGSTPRRRGHSRVAGVLRSAAERSRAGRRTEGDRIDPLEASQPQC